MNDRSLISRTNTHVMLGQPVVRLPKHALEPSFSYKQPENGGRGWFSSCEETKGLQEQILSG